MTVRKGGLGRGLDAMISENGIEAENNSNRNKENSCSQGKKREFCA